MDALQDEVESLMAILMDDVRIIRNQENGIDSIETTLFPIVGDDAEQQYVCVTLRVLPTPSYPDESPDFKLLRPRGLDDVRLEAIRTACIAKLNESLGFPVVFDLIEVVREHLSGSNLPSGQCVICLYGFSDGDEFTRTECFHYLHSYCLGRHLTALRRNYQEEYDKLPAWLQKTADPFQAACPVCRESISDIEEDSLKCAMPPTELQMAPDFKLTRELRELQQRMSNLFLRQKSRGAIIDVEAESGAVISIETAEEVRRRLQRKHEGDTVAPECSSSLLAADVSGGNEAVLRTMTTALEQKDIASSNASGSTTFAPTVQQTQRISSDPTNNNYQHSHNRRHYRGGRRHQQHHHQHRDRYEHHHTSAAASHSTAAAGTTASAPPVTNASQGKQSKAQAAGGAHSR